MDKMREEFESWILISKVCVSKGARVEVRSDGHYTDGRVDLQWKAWKASRAALCVELPENCKGMALTVDEFHKQLDKAGVSYK